MKAINDACDDNIRKRTCRTPDQEEGFAFGKIVRHLIFLQTELCK